MLTILTAIILGIVEGLTEFLPVSSTGHLILAGDLLNLKSSSFETFEVFIQLGAILAVVVIYHKRFLALLDFSPNQTGEFKGIAALTKLALGCLPAFVIGFLLHGFIKEKLFSPLTVSIALIIGGVIMIFLERYVWASSKSSPKNNKTAATLEEVSYKQSFVIGCYQLLALCPGVSRSAATIIGGMLAGLNRTLSAEFSFLLAVPVICAASMYDLYKGYSSLSSADLLPFTAGLIVSFLVALIAIKSFIKYLQKHDFIIFGAYRIILGVLFLIHLL